MFASLIGCDFGDGSPHPINRREFGKIDFLTFYPFTFMSHTIEEWSAKIQVGENGSRNDVYFTAECPICSYSHSVDVRSSDQSARVLAVAHIRRHITAMHQDKLTKE